MKLIISSNRTVKWPVEFTRAGEDGQPEVVTLDVLFNMLPDNESDKLIKKGGENGKGDRVLLGKVVADIFDLGFEDANGNPRPYKSSDLNAVLEQGYMRMGLVSGYYDALSGGLLKNG